MKGFELSDPAAVDLKRIWLEVATDSIQRADKLIDRLLAVCEMLGRHPGLGELWGTRHEGLRFFPAYGNKYVIFFFPRDFGAEIARVIHGGRNLDSIIRRD